MALTPGIGRLLRALAASASLGGALVAAAAGAAVDSAPLADQGAPGVIDVPLSARTGLGLTIYNDDRAVVRDARRLVLQSGRNRLAFPDVAATLQPETAALRALDGAPWTLLEQNFDYELLTPLSLLQHQIGSAVTVIHPGPAGERREQATVLAVSPEGPVLRYADRIETGVDGRLAFASVPAGLHDHPTLSVLLEAPAEARQSAELTYQCTGIGWHADYVATLDAANQRMDLAGWVTINNQSGTPYVDARVQLVAGAVSRVAPEMAPAAALRPLALQRGAALMPTQEPLLDFHLYTLPRPTSLLDRQIKQVALLSADRVPATREYVLETADSGYWQRPAADTQSGLKPVAWLRFDNRAPALGMPLPAGVVRVYVRDSRGGSQLVGEDRLGHTAKGEAVRLRLGEAFDLTADRVQTDFRALSARESQSTFRIEVRNGGSSAATVEIRERVPGQWKVIEESLPHRQADAGTLGWSLSVPAEGRAVLTYAVRTHW